MLDRLTGTLAVVGTIIATGQAASTWINSIYIERAAIVRSSQELELEKLRAGQELELASLKGRQDLEIEKVKNASDLAESYLKTLFSQDRQSGDRIILLDALRQIEGHPLRAWAEDRFNREVNFEKEMERLAELKAAATQQGSQLEQEQKELEISINELRLRIGASGIPTEKEQLYKQLTANLGRLGVVNANLKVSQLQVRNIDQTVSLNSRALMPEISSAALNNKVSSLADAVTPQLLAKIFRNSPKLQTDYVYLQNAVKEFGISDPRMLAAIIATLAIEAPTFDAGLTETETAAARYEGRISLGNIYKGDGVRYRGRGYIGLTGREQYASYSKRLGLGQLLVDNPEEASKPEIAARIAVAFFVDRAVRINRNLDEGDFAGIRRAVVGSNNNTNQLKKNYSAIVDDLRAQAR